MPSRTELVPMDAKQFLSGIQTQIDALKGASNGSAEAVHFFPSESANETGDQGIELFLHDDNFNEEDYLISNPDVITAIARGEVRSGFEHWTKLGKSEKRSFAPIRFAEHEYLELNPDAADGIRSAEFKSGRDHWLRRGRMEGRSIRKSVKSFALRIMRGNTELQVRASQIGEMPESPDSLRGAIGKRVILLMRRLLWWYTCSLAAFAQSVTKQLQAHITWFEHLEKTQAQDRQMVQSIREMVTEVSAEQRNLAASISRLEADARVISEFKDHILGGFSQLSSRIEELSATVAALQSARATDHSLDSIYFAFEEAFRGPRDTIKSRLSMYLPFLAEAHAGTPERPVLDLGCGRGEWMELLGRQRMTVRGVDGNSAMVAFCRAFGFNVEQADALAFLRCVPDCSLGAITSFHMIEHLPFNTIAALLNESMRVLMPGGLLILETPNPKNLIVASHNFYLDPTHLKPLPPAMLQFFVEASGFQQIQVLGLQPASVPAGCEDVAASKCLNELLYGPQDYGLIARHP